MLWKTEKLLYPCFLPDLIASHGGEEHCALTSYTTTES